MPDPIEQSQEKLNILTFALVDIIAMPVALPCFLRVSVSIPRLQNFHLIYRPINWKTLPCDIPAFSTS